MVEPYNRSHKKYPGKFYEEPLDGFFILCRERGGDVVMYLYGMCLSGGAKGNWQFRNPLMR